ncbi:MAG: hypothetical protein RLZZ450_7741 [Pseudomonadota bacterium]|jgi:hypothetical protein
MSSSSFVVSLLVVAVWVHASGCGRFGVELVADETRSESPSTSVDASIDVLDAGAPIQSEPDAVVSAPVCQAGFADCDRDVSASCETDLATTANHCGSCGNVCSYEHAGASCRAGRCALGACTVGYADCDGDAQNGCEVSVDTASNCGACGKVCSASGVAPLCTAEGCGTACDVTGTWAVLVDFQVTWDAQSVVAAGSGRLRYWQRLELEHGRGGVSGTATSCGTALPNSKTALGGGETFGSVHPASLFDVEPSSFAPVAVAMALSGEVPGSSFMLPAFAMTRGIVLSNPLTDLWPTSAYGVIASLDEDKDGQVGITVPFKNGEGVVYPALDLLRATRADQSYSADRFIYGATGSLRSCLRAEGTADVSTFDARILACRVSGLGPCSLRQRDLLDSNVPVYVPSNGRFSMVRLPPSASCVAVRAALP